MSQDPVKLTSSVAKSDKESLVENNLFTIPLIRLIFLSMSAPTYSLAFSKGDLVSNAFFSKG